MFNVNRVETYPNDLPLFKKLKLKPFNFETKGLGKQEEYYVGRVENEDDSVQIYMTGLPAQFWRFVIHCNETNTDTEFSTGNGVLSDFWGFADAIMQGMVVIKQNKLEEE
jgi:hypothetical protein